MKKATAVSRAVAVILASSLVGNVAAQPSGARTIPAGTGVVCAFNTDVRPGNVAVGDKVAMSVSNDVVVGGRVLIRKGAPVQAQVTRAKKRGAVGAGAELAIQLATAEAVDGTQVPLQATKTAEGDDKVVVTVILALICLPLFLLKGGDAIIPAGSTVNATVTANTEIR